MLRRGPAVLPASPSRRRQRGASAVFVAISMVASIAALGMALDLGRLYYTHRDLQLLADMAALDAARARGGCMGKVEDPQGAAAGEAASSLQRNGASLAYLTAGAVELGRETQVGGVRTFVADNSARADSVRVTLRRPLPSKLVPIFSSGSGGTMSVTAAANMRPIVSFDVGSSLANANPAVANQLLPPLLGAGANVGLLDTGGLASATVTLGDLAAAAHAGSVQDFLDTQTTAPALLGAIADALSSTSDSAVKTTLTALASGSGTADTVVPREILGVSAGSTADDAVVSVGTLVGALADSADGQSVLNVSLPVNVPLLGEGDLTIHLLELARPAIGPPTIDANGNPQTIANTAQGLITGGVALRPILGNQVAIKVYAQLAAASGAVTNLECSQRGRPNSTVTIDTQTSAGRFGIGDIVDLRSPDPQFVTVAKLPGIEIQAKLNIDLRSGGAQALIFQGPFPAAPQTVGANPGDILQGAIENSKIEWNLVGPPPTEALSQQIAQVEALLDPALKLAARQLGENLIEPAANALGATLGGARVTVRSVSIDPPEIYTR